jgi:predicted DsbA family dithiol-disulfide isomerase
MTAPSPTIEVEIWSDVVCPWCYIGKRRFERAVAEVAGEIDVACVYRPYQLDPTASPGATEPCRPRVRQEVRGPRAGGADHGRHVTGVAADDGIEFHLDRALRANTRLAHRLLWLAEQPGSPVAQPDLKERLLRAYFVDGLDIGDPDTLAGCAAEIGFDRGLIIEFLESDRGAAEVRADLESAAELGITAVPTFVVNGQWAIPGAQDSDTFVNVLRRLRDRMATTAVNEADRCTDDACDV